MNHTNADAKELAKFSEQAHFWWDTESAFRPLHDINPARLDWIDSRDALSGKNVLDIGCGGGILSEGMARRGARVTGIDLSEKALSVAKLHGLESGLSNIDYRLICAEALAREAERFELITCMEMLEHVPDPQSILLASARLLSPGGSLFLSTLNRSPKAYLFAILGAEYVLKLIERGTHDFRKFLKPSELAEMGEKAGLYVERIVGLNYNPFSRACRLSEDTRVNYLMHLRKPG